VRIRGTEFGFCHQPVADQEVAAAAQAKHAQPIAQTELVEEGERVGVERAEPAGPIVAPVVRAEMLGVGPPTRDRRRLQHGRVVAGGAQPIRGRQAGRPPSHDGDPHDLTSTSDPTTANQT